LKRSGCTLDTIETIFRDHPVGDKFLEKGEHGREYLQLSFDKTSEISDNELFNYARAGQAGDGRLFIRLFQGKYCHDHATGRSYQWGGHYWIEDEIDNILMAIDLGMDLYQTQAGRCACKKAQAARDGNEKAAKQAAAQEEIFLKMIAKLQTKNWRRDVLEFAAAGVESLGISGKEWDRTPCLIACPNGVLDLETGEFRPGKPEDYIKVSCPTEWVGIQEPVPTRPKRLDICEFRLRALWKGRRCWSQFGWLFDRATHLPLKP
jgi:hypothetical protein